MPNAPDCNPLDYYGRSVVEQDMDKTLCNPKDEMKARITVVITNLNKGSIRNACRSVRSGLEARLKANGDIFE